MYSWGYDIYEKFQLLKKYGIVIIIMTQYFPDEEHVRTKS